MTFRIALIGRPNVGKSTLFNRLVGRREALVHDQPGVTRDRRFGKGSMGGLKFEVIDTAGLEFDFQRHDTAQAMRSQTDYAYEQADFIFFIVDAREGLCALDKEFAHWLRVKGNKPVSLLVNKVEKDSQEASLSQWYELGLGDPVPISAEHGLGMSDILHMIAPQIESFSEKNSHVLQEREDEDQQEDHRPIQWAIVGRPNVGKSTLVNTILDQERVLTGPQAGLTRDAIYVSWTFQGRPIELVDTPGIRRRKNINTSLEKMSVHQTRNVIEYAHVVTLLIDASLGLDKQDLTLARQVLDEGRCLVLAVNKWDLIHEKKEFLKDLDHRLSHSLPQIKGLFVCCISAKNKQGLNRLMPLVLKAYTLWNKRISTSKLNHWLEHMTQSHLPPLVKGRRIKLKYMTQAKVRPPSFYISCSRADELPESYHRYLVNGLRESFDLFGVPIRLYLRGSKNPYGNSS